MRRLSASSRYELRFLLGTVFSLLLLLVATSSKFVTTAFEFSGTHRRPTCHARIMHAYSSPLFRTTSRIHFYNNINNKKKQIICLSSSDKSSNMNDGNVNDEPINSEPPSPEGVSFPRDTSRKEKNKTSSSSSKSLFQRLDNFGQSLKPRAMEKKNQLTAAQQTAQYSRPKQIWIATQACLYFTLFILYRAYRGFFVLLPAVFRDVYQKMETIDSPFVDEPGQQDVNPTTGKVRWRTRITVSLLAAMVTMTYVVGGMVNVLMKFVKALTQTTSPTSSFEAAANETSKYEDKILKMTTSNNKQNNVNGTSSSSSSSSSNDDESSSMDDLGFHHDS